MYSYDRTVQPRLRAKAKRFKLELEQADTGEKPIVNLHRDQASSNTPPQQ